MGLGVAKVLCTALCNFYGRVLIAQLLHQQWQAMIASTVTGKGLFPFNKVVTFPPQCCCKLTFPPGNEACWLFGKSVMNLAICRKTLCSKLGQVLLPQWAIDACRRFCVALFFSLSQLVQDVFNNVLTVLIMFEIMPCHGSVCQIWAMKMIALLSWVPSFSYSFIYFVILFYSLIRQNRGHACKGLYPNWFGHYSLLVYLLSCFYLLKVCRWVFSLLASKSILHLPDGLICLT